MGRIGKRRGAYMDSLSALCYIRGKVAWEYAESTIEMWELMANINAVALKRFGVFGLVLTGQMNKDSFTRDASTLIINLSSDTSAGKQDAKVIEFPEPQKMIEYLDELENKISIFSSVSLSHHATSRTQAQVVMVSSWL